MSTLTLPAITPNMINFGLTPNTQVFSSPLNRSTQTYELPGARWRCKMEFRCRTENDARQLKAFIARLRGSSGRFYASDLSHPTPSGTAAGSGLVKGASQTGSSIITDGWTINQTALLLPGDYIGIGGELKVVTVQAASDGTGNATIYFEPPLRTSPSDNSAITVTSPTCIMRLVDDEQDQADINPERKPTIVISALEVF